MRTRPIRGEDVERAARLLIALAVLLNAIAYRSTGKRLYDVHSS